MTASLPSIAGIPLDFVLFAAVLAGVALFHHHTLLVALIGLAVITLYKVLFSPFHGVAGMAGLIALARPRVGDDREPVRPAARLRVAVEALRGKQCAGDPAALPAR